MRLLKSARTRFAINRMGADVGNHRSFEAKNWDTDRVMFQNRQWAVTEFGLENIAGPYHYWISKADLFISMGTPDRTWRDHMKSKNWVDEDQFNEAYDRAVKQFFGEVAA